MKSWLKVALVLALAALVGVVLIGCGGGSSPASTVKGAFAAMEAKDAEKLGSYFTEDISAEVAAGAELAFSLVDKIEISNLKITTVSETADAATLQIEYDYKLTLFGQTNTDHQSNTIGLVKVDGKWLITQPLDYGAGE